MTQNTHLEIVCAEAQRFPEPPPESGANLEDMRVAAAESASNLPLAPEVASSRFFAQHWKSLKRVLPPLQVELDTSACVSEEVRWLQENTRLLNTALQDTAELVKVRKTPHVRMVSGKAVPRIAAVAESYLAVVEYRFDARAFAAYLDALQETVVLNIAEVWALVPCLKLLLVEEVAARALRLRGDLGGVYGVADCIRSLHHVGQTSWKDVLEPRILVDRILREDPAGAYTAMDFESRDRCWNAVGEIAAHSDLSEADVALAAVSLALQAQAVGTKSHDPRLAARQAHVGYYLVGEGTPDLHRKVGFHPGFRRRFASFLSRHSNAYYLTGIGALTLTVAAAVLLLVAGGTAAPGRLLLAMVALLLPSSQVAVELMNCVTAWLLPVQLLPKLDFLEGIPDDCVTIVAVPALLLNRSQVRQLVEHLEVRFLGNRDRNLHFALLTDLPDSREAAGEDDPRVALCAKLIGKLNEKYAEQRRGSFLLFHRHRVYNSCERVWMGWERKRGKLMDFARLLRQEYDSFPVKMGDLSLLRRVRFVITLDADTDLPRGAAHRMIGALAHPLNHAVIDPRRNVVVSGYGILQPRVGVSVPSAARSRLANIYGGERGLDIYTRAVSDVYQDLYQEGIYTGKGICEVDTLLAVLNHRFPENALLSHDLLEGAYARTGLVSDIELIDDYPSHYSAYSRRKHRWIRGDWQIAEWLLPRVPNATGDRVSNPLSLVSRWKIFDNLRRSLVEPAAVFLLMLGWLALPGSALRWTVAVVVLMFAPAWFHFVLPLLQAIRTRDLATGQARLDAFLAGNAATALRLTFLVHQTLLSLDAIGRALVRRLVTRRGLLEWETAAEAELRNGGRTAVELYLDWIPVVLIALALLLWVERPFTLLTAAPILLLWSCSKPVCMWLNQPPRTTLYEISAEDRLLLRRIALRTWRYFAEYSNEEQHWLIPDNVQEEPFRIAARTSPTDLGLLLNVRQVACELGYLTVPEFAELTARTLATIERLPKYRGHLFNWYDTRSLAPLAPRFISSADNGNLVAALWCLQQECLQQLRRPLLPASLLQGFLDHLSVLDRYGTALPSPARTAENHSNPTDWLQYMRDLADTLPRELDPSLGDNHRDRDLRWFLEQAHERHESIARTILSYCPWLLPEFSGLFDNPTLSLKPGGEEGQLERLPAFIDAFSACLAAAVTTVPADQQPAYRNLQALLGQAQQNSVRLIRDLQQTAALAGQLANDMDFRLLFNRWRKLLSVGFDVDSQQLHPACYDLLASEARLAVFVGIAKEDIPQETWFRLGRAHALNDGRPVLLSWTGTTFEYLMPSLWMRTYPNTLLERSQAGAVRSQQAYAARKRIPWGISESAYASRDAVGHYQYRAFGVPPLALHKDEMDALVISPYSSLLALPVDTGASMRNLRRITQEGWLGMYGFYEAADYTALRSSRRHSCELVRCWMAHHQGMSMLGIANLLHDNVVQRWFHDSPRVQATELLLQEKPVARVRKQDLQSGSDAA
ncbi:MAG: glycosyl transferase [Acidobacteriia bacterium]|nr:glycosyl transferase [Terriglobia bacterium]